MQSTGAKLYSFLAIISFFAAVGMRLSMLLLDLSAAFGIAYYVLIATGLVLIAVDSFKQKKYAAAFEFENNFHLNAFSYLASLGFFVDFVHSCVRIFFSAQDGSYRILVSFIPLCLICLFALLSCFYFYTVGLSYGDKNYDFRELKVLHLAPLLWSVSQALSIMHQAISFSRDVENVIKYTVMIFGVCFFFCFASEIESDGGAKPSTLFLARAYSYISVIFFIDRLMLLLNGNAKISDDDGVFSLSVLLISAFVFFFEKNIIYHKSISAKED
ncbi:MAG: hypothetical protein ACLUFN_00490 [Eubacterium sp.]